MVENNKIKRKHWDDQLLTIFFYLFVGVFAFLALYPLLLAVGSSFTEETTLTTQGYNVIPKVFSLDAYKLIFTSLGANLFNAYRVTILVTVIGTLAALLVSSAFAFVLSVRDFKPRVVLNMFIYIPMIFSAGLLPWYIICTKYYHLTDKPYALILPSLMNVFNVFLLRNFFGSIPNEINEAARIDGAGYLKIYAKIYMPLAKVGLVTVGMFYALAFWNDYYNALLFINKQELYPLQYYLFNMLSNVQFMANQTNASMGYNINIPLESIKMATICITIGPIILLYPFAQKYFTRGIIVGAVKG